ncbi:MAG TPA: hypothetical protein VF107_08590 [Burkholderiaceae bacterium]
MAAGQRHDPVLKAGLNNMPIDGADRFSTTGNSTTMRSVSTISAPLLSMLIVPAAYLLTRRRARRKTPQWP